MGRKPLPKPIDPGIDQDFSWLFGYTLQGLTLKRKDAGGWLLVVRAKARDGRALCSFVDGDSPEDCLLWFWENAGRIKGIAWREDRYVK